MYERCYEQLGPVVLYRCSFVFQIKNKAELISFYQDFVIKNMFTKVVFVLPSYALCRVPVTRKLLQYRLNP